MGCSHSAPDTHPTLFKATNLSDTNKPVNTVMIEVQNTTIVVHSKARKVMTTWPIACIRRYGYNKQNILFIEAGSGCETGQGMYLFKCGRTEQIFQLMKRKWEELQRLNANPTSHHPAPGQAVTIATEQNPEYYNTNHSSGTGHVSPNGTGDAIYANSCVRLPSTSSSSTNQIPPSNAAMRGSTSSQHTSALVSLPEGTPLGLSTREQPFALQPAPTSRKEMITRRRINSDMPATSCTTTDAVNQGNAQRRNSDNADYQNNAVIVTSESFPRPHRVLYSKKKQQVTIGTSVSALPIQELKTTSQGGTTESHNLSQNGLDSLDQDISTMSLRSDCDPQLTPGSKSSGIGSLNGNGASSLSNNPPPIPPTISDPWKRQPLKFNKRRYSPPICHSARDYVNTFNASLDVSGTPLPATAVGAMHFNFDFVHLGFPRASRPDRSKLNYVPVEAFKNSDGDYNCGASSASSGIPGTPRTPKTPKTPLSNHQSTDYAMIDHNKTRALSNAHRARQRERKSFRHANTEATV